MKISEIIKKAKNSENDLSDEILAALDNKEVLLELGFEDLEYCFKNQYISKKDLSFIFNHGDRSLKLAVMDLGFNPARAGIDYAKKNNDFEIASRVFELGVDVVKDDFVWAVNQDRTEFYKYFKDRPNLIPYSLINKLMSEKRFEDVVKLIEAKGKFPGFLLKNKEYIKVLEILDADLWPEVTSEVLRCVAKSGKLDLFKLALEYNPDVDEWVLGDAAESGNIDLFKLALEYNSEVTEDVLKGAAWSGNSDLFKLVLEYNSEVDEWVLQGAAYSGNIDIFKLALEYNPKVTDWVLGYAERSRNLGIFKLALEKKYPAITEVFGELDLLSFDFRELNDSIEYTNLSKSLFGVVKPNLTLAINQIVTEESFGFFNFLHLLKKMSCEYETKDVLRINKKGEILDKLDISIEAELIGIVVGSKLYELVFKILKNPKALAKFFSNKDLNNYRDTSRSFDFLMKKLERAKITQEDLTKTIIKRAKKGDIEWLHKDLSKITRKIGQDDYGLNQDISGINNKKIQGADGEYTVIVPRTYYDLVDISAVANICVGDPEQRYGKRCANGEIYLVELRKNGKFIAMLEIENGKVIQQQTYNGKSFSDKKAITELLKLI